TKEIQLETPLRGIPANGISPADAPTNKLGGLGGAPRLPTDGLGGAPRLPTDASLAKKPAIELGAPQNFKALPASAGASTRKTKGFARPCRRAPLLIYFFPAPQKMKSLPAPPAVPAAKPKGVRKRRSRRDTEILNFALALEHLVVAFYTSGLERYGVRAFRGAGHEVWTRRRFEQIARNARTHVQFLESALGGGGARACRYELKDKSLGDWVAKAFVLENIAVAAWNGFVGILQDRSYQTVAASIMGVKARHAAWINSVVRNSNAWNTAFETPLDMNQIYTLIAPHIVPGSCPSSNAPLRASAFPTLHVPPCRPGSTIALEYARDANANTNTKNAQLFAAFVSGTGTVFAAMREEGKVDVPPGLVGVVYVFVTRDGGKVGTEGIVAGPGVVWFGFRA
ncbi:hypothetical protein C0992_003021, partial [Termitomyces sp. T32_za158]